VLNQILKIYPQKAKFPNEKNDLKMKN